MGCGFSHRVVPNTASSETEGVQGAGGNGVGSFISGRAVTIPTDVIGNAALKVKDTSLSFIVPIRDHEDFKGGSIIRRHPPVRLRRLEEEQQVDRPKLTLGALERRQAEAEERRRKILDSRVQSAQHFQRKVQSESGVAVSPSPQPLRNWDQEGEKEKDQDKDRESKRIEPELNYRRIREEFLS